MRGIRVVVAAVAATSALAGCGGTQGQSAEPSQSRSATETEAHSPREVRSGASGKGVLRNDDCYPDTPDRDFLCNDRALPALVVTPARLPPAGVRGLSLATAGLHRIDSLGRGTETLTSPASSV